MSLRNDWLVVRWVVALWFVFATLICLGTYFGIRTSRRQRAKTEKAEAAILLKMENDTFVFPKWRIPEKPIVEEAK